MAKTKDLSIAETIRQGLAPADADRAQARRWRCSPTIPCRDWRRWPSSPSAPDVSGPTILRLVAKLGFSSYPRFQQALRDELEVAAASRRWPRRRHGLGRPRRRRDFLGTYGRAIVANIERSLSDLPRAEFEGALELLADRRRRISLVGGRFTASLALQFYLHLRELRPRVQLVSGQTATWVEHLLDFGRKDVLVVFDIRRYQEDVVRFAQEAASLGADIVLFTDPWLSPIAAVARHVFALRTGAPSSWESFAALSALTEVMVARLQERCWGEAKRRMETLEKLRARLQSR